MDTLLNAYRDDEEDDSETIPQIQPTPIQINPTPESNSIELNPTQESNSIELNPTQESNLAENNPIHESTVAIENNPIHENNPVCENSSKIEENPFVESNRVRIGEEIDALNPNPDPTTSPKEVGYEEPEYKPEEMEVELTNMSENLGSEDVSSESISEEDPNPDYSDTKKLMGDEELEEIEEEEEEEDDDEETPLKKKKQKSMSNFEVDQSELIPESQMTPLNGNEGVGSGKKSSNKKKTKGNNVWTKTTSRKGKKKAKNSHNGSNGGSNNVVAPKAEDTVLITPIPRFPDKNDDSPEAKICLSKVNKAEKVELSEDRMSAGSCKGHRMVRATRGVNEGAWYYEIKVVGLGETGHTRLGWSTEKGDLQAPVGYDANSFGYRDIDGSKIHKALREKYGEEGYKEGDVIGFYINLPDGSSFAPQPPRLVWYKGQKYVCAPDPKEDPPKIIPGSEISFFKNGICQGVAFKDLFGGRYFPAASMYTLPNQPNCVVKFNFGPDFEFFPTDFEGRPVPNPMIGVPYHGFDNRDENGVLDEIKQ